MEETAAAETGTGTGSSPSPQMVKLIVILAIVVAVGFFGKKILDGILEALNLKDTEAERLETKEIKTGEKKTLSAFLPTYYQNPPKGYYAKINKELAMEGGSKAYPYELDIVAKKIYESIGYIYDSPEDTKAGFGKIKNKVELSQVAAIFSTRYGRDLQAFLSSKLDTDIQKNTWALILQQVGEMPTGFVKYTPAELDYMKGTGKNINKK